MALPTDAKERNEFPMFDGLLAYFPAALAAVSRVSKIGNDQHNPGESMHWARGKSTDHENKIVRHLLESGTIDTDGTRHSAKVAWRALALLQEELEREEGAPVPRNARVEPPLELVSVKELLYNATEIADSSLARNIGNPVRVYYQEPEPKKSFLDRFRSR